MTNAQIGLILLATQDSGVPANGFKHESWIIPIKKEKHLFYTGEKVVIERLDSSSINTIPYRITTQRGRVRNKDFQMLSYPIEGIKELKFRKKRSGLKGALIGAAVGLGVGIVSGAAIIKYSDSYEGILYGTLAFGTSIYLGAIKGGAKITIPINGKVSNYKRQQKEIEKYLVLKEL